MNIKNGYSQVTGMDIFYIRMLTGWVRAS